MLLFDAHRGLGLVYDYNSCNYRLPSFMWLFFLPSAVVVVVNYQLD